MNKNKFFITLPVIDFVIKNFPLPPIKKEEVAVISVQHLLETTGSMFEGLFEYGIDPKNTFVLGKLYSNDQRTIAKLRKISVHVFASSNSNELGDYYDLLRHDCIELWNFFLNAILNTSIKKVIILDDGGMLLQTMPDVVKQNYDVAGIEQTSSGIKSIDQPTIPVVNVAKSLVKSIVEPAFISQAVIKKTRMKLIKLNPKRIGIIGFGTIGRGLFIDLKDTYEVLVFDKNPDLLSDSHQLYIKFSSTLENIYKSCDVIIGATGEDISWIPILELMSKDKLLMSVSSGDVEFRSLLREISRISGITIQSILEDVTYSNNGNRLTILRGGTPVNFDNNIHSVYPEYIQLTRGLLLLAIVQAVNLLKDNVQTGELVSLDLEGQFRILQYFSSLPEIELDKFDFIPPLPVLFNELSEFQI